MSLRQQWRQTRYCRLLHTGIDAVHPIYLNDAVEVIAPAMETDKVLQAPRKPESIRPEGAKTTLKLMRQKCENLYHLYPESG